MSRWFFWNDKNMCVRWCVFVLATQNRPVTTSKNPFGADNIVQVKRSVRMLITHIWLNDKNVCIYPTHVDVQLCGHCHLPLSPVDESMFVLLLMSVCLRGDYKSPQMHAIFIAYRMVKTDIWLADTNPFSICASYTTCSSTTVSVCHSWPRVRIYAMWRESSLYRMWCN